MTRTEKEMHNLFKDPKFSRQAWQSVGRAILQNPAHKAPVRYDKNGDLTFASELDDYTYNQLSKDIKSLGDTNREPTELEMILYGQIVKARFDTAAATFVRDTLGAKPVDESKLDASIHNPYESLSDEELELIAAHRQAVLSETPVAINQPNQLPFTIPVADEQSTSIADHDDEDKNA